MIETAAPHLQGVGHVRERRGGVGSQMGGQIPARRAKRRCTPGRQNQDLRRLARIACGRGRAGRLFQYNVHVGAADAERANAGPPRTTAFNPGRERGS